MRHLFPITLLLWGSICMAQVPSGYYDAVNGKKDSQIKTALYDIIKGHSAQSYDALWNHFKNTDRRSDGKVWDMYSTCSFVFGGDQCGNYASVCDCYNREHSFPKSWFNDATPMYTDLYHLYPTDGKVNGQRSNYAFGECSGGTTLARGKGRLGKSTFSGYSGTVFEPDDEFKGDFARTYFYMVTRYQNVVSGWTDADARVIVTNNTYPSLTPYAIDLLLKWHRQDPVSDKEIERNNAVSKIQRNRNPFIDFPAFAEYIWGNKKGESYNPSTSIDESEQQNITVYRSNNKVFVNNPYGKGRIEVFNEAGQLIDSRTANTGLNEVSNLGKGLLMIRVTTPETRTTRKVVI